MDTSEDGKDARQDAAVIFKDDNGVIRCPHCNQDCLELRSLQRHVLNENNAECHKNCGQKVAPHGCLKCRRAYSDAKSLAAHKCNPKTSKSKRKHKRKHPPEQTDASEQSGPRRRLPALCAKCAEFQEHDGNYWRHRAVAHKDGKPLACETSAHRLCTGHLANSHKCASCADTFGRSDYLVRHVLRDHNFGDEKKLQATFVVADTDHIIVLMKAGIFGLGSLDSCLDSSFAMQVL